MYPAFIISDANAFAIILKFCMYIIVCDCEFQKRIFSEWNFQEIDRFGIGVHGVTSDQTLRQWSVPAADSYDYICLIIGAQIWG